MLQALFTHLTSLVSALDPWQQVPALVPVGAIPFVESYLGSFLGTLVGIHPLIAVPAAVLGNLLATFAVTALAGGARDAVIRGRAATVPASSTPGAAVPGTATQVATVQAATSGRFRSKVAAALDKYGVPGVCLLGPRAAPAGTPRAPRTCPERRRPWSGSDRRWRPGRWQLGIGRASGRGGVVRRAERTAVDDQ